LLKWAEGELKVSGTRAFLERAEQAATGSVRLLGSCCSDAAAAAVEVRTGYEVTGTSQVRSERTEHVPRLGDPIALANLTPTVAGGGAPPPPLPPPPPPLGSRKALRLKRAALLSSRYAALRACVPTINFPHKLAHRGQGIAY